MEKAKPSDAAAIMAVVNEAYKLEIGDSGVSFKNEDRIRAVGEVIDLLGDTWVVRDREAVAGVLCAKVDERGVICVGPLAVAKKHQGKGIGSKLLDFAEGLSHTTQVDVVSCRTDLFPLYRKRGYVEISRYPAEEYVPPKSLTRSGLQMVLMHKTNAQRRKTMSE